MIKIKVSTKGQVVIPVEVRTRFGIDAGTELELREGPSYISLHLLPDDPIKAARGLLKQDSRSLVRDLLAAKHPASGERNRSARGQERQGGPDLPVSFSPTLFGPPA